MSWLPSMLKTVPYFTTVAWDRVDNEAVDIIKEASYHFCTSYCSAECIVNSHYLQIQWSCAQVKWTIVESTTSYTARNVHEIIQMWGSWTNPSGRSKRLTRKGRLFQSRNGKQPTQPLSDQTSNKMAVSVVLPNILCFILCSLTNPFQQIWPCQSPCVMTRRDF